MTRLLRIMPLVGVVLLIAACTSRPDPGPRRAAPSPAAPSPAAPSPAAPSPAAPSPAAGAGHPYVGMWVTADGHIRQELRPDGRYDEARGNRRSAYTGSYTVEGNEIFYVDDTGFTADGTFHGPDELHHGGYIFHRE